MRHTLRWNEEIEKSAKESKIIWKKFFQKEEMIMIYKEEKGEPSDTGCKTEILERFSLQNGIVGTIIWCIEHWNP